tara:strand:+ start:419 stop:634 length:216 start_codon:yes stop_codon:yes gene_type:complete
VSRRWWLLGVSLVAGCVFGPFEIVHEKGSLPKGRVNVSDNCAIRARVNNDRSNARYICYWFIDEYFNVVEK